MRPPHGATNAFLTSYHVDRGMIYARERFAESDIINQERVAQAVDITRFPVPEKEQYTATDTVPALVRAAALIGKSRIRSITAKLAPYFTCF